ncbi:MAG: amino acid adenylation domain-containing protein [Chloroflexota bacterium]
MPLSFAQQRLWFLDQLDATPFNIPLTLRLRGQLNIAALAASINTIVQRHSSLRTTFTTNGDNPSQQINPFMPIPLQQIDLTHLPSDAQLAEAEKLATAESLRPFNLQQDCLLRATLLHLDTENFVLLITVHHIAADGWSMGVLLDELTAVYTITIQQNPTILPPLPIQYHDYALWQRNWLQGDVLDQQLAYWQRQLADPPLGLALPTDYPRRPNMPFTAALHRFSLSPAASQRLKQFSQQERSTLFMTLLTIFKILLYRYTGQNDIIIGTPIANRTQQEIEQLIGFFVNTLVLRSQVNGNTSIRDLLTNVRQMALDAYSHQDVPFEKLVEVLQPERDLSRTPFFQIMFILQNAPQSTHDLPDLTVESFPLGERLAQYDLTTVMWEDGDCLQGVIEYKTALFEADTIAQFCRHFERLLTAVPLNPTEKIANLPLLSEAETAVLQAQQQPKTAPIKPRAVHQLFEETAVRHPHAIALDTGTQTLSYSQLNAQANQLAHYLRQKGIGHGQTVALLLYRSAATITAMLATHKSGAAYLLLDPDAPADRLHTMLDDAQPSLILTQSAINLTTTIPTVALDQLTMLDSYPNNNPNTSYQPDTPAYLIYTSGSTGKPKGVLIPHRAITNHCQAITAEYGLKSADRVLQFASLSFDVAAEEIFPTLAAGATLVLRPTDLPINFSRYVADQQLTVLNLPAAYWHDWVAHSHAQQQPIPACVRLMVVGSEKVLAERLTQWREIAPPDCRWLNAYGPTEATITATIYEPCLETIDVNEETGVGQTAVPIGHPIANTTVHILDSHHNLVLNGVAGELYIGGDGLALGYWQRPDLTAAAFVTHPQTGERLYKTGDIVRRLPCGSLAFMGRRDHQVKVRGFRIEFGEIELALRTHQELQDCLVIAQETADQPTRLIAYCIPNKNAPTPNDLRQFLQTRLPSYMVPAAFVLLDEFPLTTSGKINRRALPLPDSSPTASYIPPDGDTEQTIATIWAEVLQQPQVGRHDNFFDLGGHSLLATQIVSRIRQALTIELPIRALFESPTVAELASNLPTPDLFDDTEEALLAELLDEFEELDFDELMHDLS